MSTMNELTNDLAIFASSDEKYAEEWTAEEAEAADAEMKELGAELMALSLAAYINYGSSCGFASSGRLAYVVNRRRDRAVRATIRVNWTRGIDSGSYQTVKNIPAGGRVRLGCTRSNAIPVTDYRFTVVGAQVI